MDNLDNLNVVESDREEFASSAADVFSTLDPDKLIKGQSENFRLLRSIRASPLAHQCVPKRKVAVRE